MVSSNGACVMPVASSVAVTRRRKVRFSPCPTRPVAGVWRVRVIEVRVEAKRVGTRGTAGAPNRELKNEIIIVRKERTRTVNMM